ncbi:MAG: periplasmic heavy metal sensor [Rhodobacterales bacterium]|nr:periplasmic heavy metal sensor [Rhodobacterales bacterium]MDX5500149.1 periplasmic heavy metal sensor [Rhodobacterales bacterium]
MTDTPSPAPQTPRMSRRMRWLLIGSLTLNLLVVGVVAGAALRFAGGDLPPPPRSIGFGPWSAGLDRDDHKALRKAFAATGHDFRGEWRAERADREALVAALRTEPFDAEALRAIAQRMTERSQGRMELGQRLVLDHIEAMTPEQRKAFADRIEKSRKRDDKDGDKGKGDDRGGPSRD